jgi:hypothetical protein
MASNAAEIVFIYLILSVDVEYLWHYFNCLVQELSYQT